MAETNKERILTKGNVEVQNIKIGDIHYEFDMGMCIKSEVLTLPKKNADGNWIWQSKSLKNGRIIDYLVNPEYPHYSVNLYDYEAYSGCKQL
jgi:hypothetical protein